MDAEERQLSDRERTVLLLAAEGLTDKEIAKHLNLSQRTIGTYWERMRQKLGPFSRTQLVARFLRTEAGHGGEGDSYQHLFSTWEEGVWILSPEQKTIYANERMAELLGLPFEDLAETSPKDVFTDASTPNLSSFFDQAVREQVAAELKLVRQDGRISWLSVKGSPVAGVRRHTTATILLARDMTMQRRVTNTLDACQAALEFLAEHSSDLIIRFGPDLKCLSINKAAGHVLKVDAASVVGKHVLQLSDVLTPNELWIVHLEEALRTGDVQLFSSSLEATEKTLRTYVLPEPSLEASPVALMTITTLNGVASKVR